MAYLKEIAMTCDYPGCKSRATYELCGRRNNLFARYCTKHGRQELKSLARVEQNNDEAIRQNPDLKGKLA